MKRVRVNSKYRYNPCLWDVVDKPCGDPQKGDIVKVVNLYGCPKANTMGHCYIVNPVNGDFLGLVNVNSLERIA